jgi:dTDP-4-amino-4,6-dideoxygalactose transaminase
LGAVGTKYAKGVASGTDALRLGARAAACPGDEVSSRPTRSGGRRGLVDCGARPVAVDIRRDDLGPDPEHLAALVGPGPAILVVHLYGSRSTWPDRGAARERGLVVIEDCSHAHNTLDGVRRQLRAAGVQLAVKNSPRMAMRAR